MTKPNFTVHYTDGTGGKEWDTHKNIITVATSDDWLVARSKDGTNFAYKKSQVISYTYTAPVDKSKESV